MQKLLQSLLSNIFTGI